MAVSAGAGELRTKIYIFDTPPGEKRNKNGFTTGEQENVFGPGGFRRCKWANAWGREVYDARQAGVTEPATLTLRYSPKITATCTVYRGEDPRPYEVISVNDVENRHAWLEIKVQRKVAAK